MDADWRSRVKELFQAARERRPEERSAYLAEACGDNAELRRELESLLIEHDRQGTAAPAPADSSPAARERAEKPPGDPLVGATLGRYRILGVVGKGGMGTVYEAEDPELRRKVALKVLPPAVAGDPKRLERFKREARSAAALSHPNVVTLHSVEEEGDTHFLTMELVGGETLDRLIPKHGLDLGEILDRATQLAEGLRAAHEQGIIHRDLKPANLIVDTEGRLRILDFGLARSQPARPDASQAETSLALTVEGTVLGTAPYMSPEQVEGKPLDARSDIFSFGSILYEMATGRWPFPGEALGAITAAILRDEPTRLRGLRSDLPEGLQRIVGRCLAKEPAKRYQSARELRDALAELRRQAPPAARRLVAGRWVALAAGLAGLALVGVLMLRSGAERSPAPTETAGPASDDSAARQMIVVLPFDNLGPPEDEYFAAGMTQEITSRLSGVSAVGVISTNTAFQYAGSDKSTAQIGAELGVDYLIRGSVRWARQKGGKASRIRIEPRLVQVQDDLQTWSQVYDREFDDVFAIQSEIARAVVAQLGGTLSRSDLQAVDERPTENLEAYQAYLRALVDRGRVTDCNDLEQRIENLDRAVQLDPGFARAWANLAIRHASYYTHCQDPSKERRAMARRALDRAVQLSPGSVGAVIAAATFALQIERDYDAALVRLEAAGEAVENSSGLLVTKATILRRKGRWEEAIDHYQRAARRRPRSAYLVEQIASSQMWVGNYTEALEGFDHAISLSPDSAFSLFRKAVVFWLRGDTRSARAILESLPASASSDLIHWTRFWQEIYEGSYQRALESLDSAEEWIRSDIERWPKALCAAHAYQLLGEADRAHESFAEARGLLEAEIQRRPGVDMSHRALSIAYAGLGLEKEAIAEARRAMEIYPLDQHPWFGITGLQNLALVYTMVGQHDAALQALETVLSSASLISIPLLELDPRWAPLREHPRFQGLKAKYGRTAAAARQVVNR
jgi:serine/threonine-protein kinase